MIICWSPKALVAEASTACTTYILRQRGAATVFTFVSSYIDMPDYDTTLLKRASALLSGPNSRAPDYDKTLVTIIPTSGSMLVRAVLLRVCR